MTAPLTDTQLAVLARDVQWSLDEVAFTLPTGRCGQDDLARLIDKLEALTAQLKNRSAINNKAIDGTASA